MAIIRETLNYPLVVHSLFDKQVLISLSDHFDLGLSFEYIDSGAVSKDKLLNIKNKYGYNMIIRDAQKDDLPGLLSLYEHLHQHDSSLPSHSELDKIWSDIINNPCIYCIIGEKEKVLISSCVLVIVPNLTRGARPYGLIENLVTHSNFRQKGHANAILQKAIKIARLSNCYKVMLLSNRKRYKAHSLYENAGFERESKYGFIAKIE
ncbi:MAG: GNAT family N-acetyltransferase [Desulfobacterales bacterium]|nr:GNAT family N-acetyltransferase [Desulfobacterales bacterium]